MFENIFIKLIVYLRLSKTKDIYTANYYEYTLAAKGDYRRLVKGIYNRHIGRYAFNKIIAQKIDIFGLDKSYIKSRLRYAEELILTNKWLTKKNGLAKTKLNELLIKKKNELRQEKKQGDENELIKLISEYLNKSISPHNITVYEVYQTIERIKDANNRKRKNNK